MGVLAEGRPVRFGFRGNYLKGYRESLGVAYDDRVWLKLGEQKRAVIASLRKPLCGVEMLARARQSSPKIRLRDIRLILRKMQQRGLARCLNPEDLTGRLYFFTGRGIELAREEFGIPVSSID